MADWVVVLNGMSSKGLEEDMNTISVLLKQTNFFHHNVEGLLKTNY